jgi:hypothetical protein
MIYFIVTTCLLGCKLRESQYIEGITKLSQVIRSLHMEDRSKIIVVENNGPRETLFDTLVSDIAGAEIYYTENNSKQTSNKGTKELQDVFDCITKYNIQDTDFIVKITGRYVLEDNSEFMNAVKDIHATTYDCVIKYGPFWKPVDYKMDDCITGLIGMSCFYVKQIEYPYESECVEIRWAKATYLMDDEKIHRVNQLGINICPGSNTYFIV